MVKDPETKSLGGNGASQRAHRERNLKVTVAE